MGRVAPQIKRSKPNLRMLRLLLVVVLLVAVAFGVRQLACSGDSGSSNGDNSGTSTTDENGGNAPVTIGEGGGEVTVSVGEPFVAAGLTVVVTTLTETPTPTGARYPMDDGRGRVAVAGESFYQAFARAENAGDLPARLDPLHFFLDGGEFLIPVDPTRTGPGARSLIHGASLDFIVTFLGPSGLDPRLVYRPPGGGTVIIQGVRPPDAVNGTVETAHEADAGPTDISRRGAA